MRSRAKRHHRDEEHDRALVLDPRWKDQGVEVQPVNSKHTSANIAQFIGAQEQERARIARELHDSVGQHLAIIANQIRRIRDKGVRTEIGQILGNVERLLGEIARYFDDLAHRLHPAVLDISGLAAAMRSLCAEFQQREGIKVTFQMTDLPRFRNKEGALALYRIVQEALQNIKKHSRSKRAEVTMSRAGDLLLLTVRDHGVGISRKPGAAGELRKGLGLIGIRERVQLLGGTLKIKTYPGQGTEVMVEVPIQGVIGDVSKRPAA